MLRPLSQFFMESAPQNLPTEPLAQPPRLVSRARWLGHLVILAALPIAVAIVGLAHRGADRPALTHGVSGLLLVCVKELLITGVLFGFAWLLSRASRDDLLLRWRLGFWAIPLGLGYSVAMRMIVGVTLGLLAGILVVSRVISAEHLQEFVMQNRPKVEVLMDVPLLQERTLYFWLSITLVSFVVAGLREELWRAGMLAGLRRVWPGVFGTRAGEMAAVVVVALLFGLGHAPQGIIAVVLTAFIGLILGGVMAAHRSVWPAVIAHGAFDAGSIIMLAFLNPDLLRQFHLH